jgi:ADP-ribosyl-[dinitrogen reductase] hydrolase
VSNSIVGSLLGTAVGDALGLPYENLSPRRARKLLGEPVRYRLLFGRGMVSDDTEHSCLVAQALVRSRLDPERFGRELASSLRWWVLGLPAGAGSATLRAAFRLWMGFSFRSSGVHSAGNGPAMRSAILGAAVDDLDLLARLVRVSARITHTDPLAEWAAHAVALAARTRATAREYLALVQARLGEEAQPFLSVLERAVRSVEAGESTQDFCRAEGFGDGVSGFSLHSVPVALHAWLRNQTDLEAAVMEVIRCGGDTDTTAAIVGGIVGAAVGREGIPEGFLGTLFEWPRTVAWMERLGEAVDRQSSECPRLSPISLLARNLLFLIVVLIHGLRRLLPPY